MFDADKSLVIWNSKWASLAALPTGYLKPGLSMLEISRQFAKRGDYGDGDPEELAQARMKLLWDGTHSQSEIKFRDRYLQIANRPKEDGGLVVTVTDITGQKHAEDELCQKNELAALLSRITAAANQSTDVTAAVGATLKEVCVQFGWLFGHAFQPRENDPDQLESLGVWYSHLPAAHLKLKKITENMEFLAGRGLPGRTLASREVTWVTSRTGYSRTRGPMSFESYRSAAGWRARC